MRSAPLAPLRVIVKKKKKNKTNRRRTKRKREKKDCCSLFLKKKNISRSPLFLTPTFAPALPSSSTPLVSRDPSPSISTKIEPKKLKRGSSNAVRLIETHRFQTPSIDPLFDLFSSLPSFLCPTSPWPTKTSRSTSTTPRSPTGSCVCFFFFSKNSAFPFCSLSHHHHLFFSPALPRSLPLGRPQAAPAGLARAPRRDPGTGSESRAGALPGALAAAPRPLGRSGRRRRSRTRIERRRKFNLVFFSSFFCRLSCCPPRPLGPCLRPGEPGQEVPAGRLAGPRGNLGQALQGLRPKRRLGLRRRFLTGSGGGARAEQARRLRDPCPARLDR